MIENNLLQNMLDRQRDVVIQRRPAANCTLLWTKRELVDYYREADRRRWSDQAGSKPPPIAS